MKKAGLPQTRRMSWRGKRVVITGGTGFIGSVLTEQLLALGALVRVPIRSQHYRSLSKVRADIEWVSGDLRDGEYCAELLEGVDHLFHLASHRRNVEFHQRYCSDVMTANTEMTLALIHGLREHPHIPVTFFSTANVPRTIDTISLREAKNIDGYVLGKAVCEAHWLAAARQLGFSLLIVRPVGAYGPRDTFSEEGNVIPSLMLKAQESDEVLVVWGSGKQERVFLYVDDLIAAVLTLLRNGVSGIQYIAPPHSTTVAFLSKMIRDLVAPDLRVQFDSSKPEGQRSIPILPLHPALRRFRWTPLSVGLKRTYDGWRTKRAQ